LGVRALPEPSGSGGWVRTGGSGIISRILCPREGGGGHFSGTGLTAGLERLTRECERRGPRLLPYSAFLRVGFTLPGPSPAPR